MNIWHDINPKRITADRFIACIEISKGSKNKYELDKETGRLFLDRVLYTSTHYPANYGFIPKTYCDDNDPLDVLVLCSESIIPLALVECIPIGVLKMVDDDETDEKIIAICPYDPSMSCYTDVSQVPQHLFQEIMHFFTVYKQLEGKQPIVKEVLGAEEAKKVIQEALIEYKKKF